MDPALLVAVEIAFSLVISISLTFRLWWGFDFVALCGLIITYTYFLEGIADAWIQEWIQRLYLQADTAKPLDARFPWIITVQAVADILFCAILLRLGRRYRLDNTSTSIAYKLAVFGIVLNTMYFIVRIIFITHIFTSPDDPIRFTRPQNVANLAVMVGPQIIAYLYAFTPSLRVMFAMSSARNPSNAIGAHRAAEGTWYAGFATVQLFHDILKRVVACSTTGTSSAVGLQETLHIVIASFSLLAFAMPVPRAVVEKLERTYAGRVTPKFEEGV